MPTFGYAAVALIAFAANSVLCRIALRGALVDPATFSTIRLVSGAATLLAVARLSRGGAARTGGSWPSALILALYAIPFSFAYTALTVGTGALIMFGSVQVTMLVAALQEGESVRAMQWLGLTLAVGGLVYLVLPGLAAPSPTGAALMALAGVAWAVYSLRGRRAPDPLRQTAANFVRAVPVVFLISLLTFRQWHVEPSGALLAAVSGIFASGLGYVIWYAALRGLTALRAAVVQLAVPILAAAGGVLFLAETISVRLVVASVMVLGGIVLTMTKSKV